MDEPVDAKWNATAILNEPKLLPGKRMSQDLLRRTFVSQVPSQEKVPESLIFSSALLRRNVEFQGKQWAKTLVFRPFLARFQVTELELELLEGIGFSLLVEPKPMAVLRLMEERPTEARQKAEALAGHLDVEPKHVKARKSKTYHDSDNKCIYIYVTINVYICTYIRMYPMDYRSVKLYDRS